MGSYTVPTQSTQPVAVSGSNGSFAFSTLSLGNSNGLLFYSTNGSIVGSYTVPSTAGLLSAINVSAGTTSTNASAFTFSNSNNVSFGLNGRTVTASASFAQTNQSAIKGLGASNTGNTAGNTGLSTGIDWVIAGSQAVTISQSTVGGGPNTLWVNAPNAGAGNVTFSAGANSAGLASIVFSNSNGVSFGLNGSTITASAAGGGGGGIGAGVSTGGNTAGSTGTITTGNLILVGGSNISLSQSTGAAGSNATVTINAPNSSSLVAVSPLSISTNGSTISISINERTIGMFGNYSDGEHLAVVNGQDSLIIQPFFLQAQLRHSEILFPINYSNATNSSNSCTITVHVGIYTRNAGSLSLLQSSSSSFNITNSGTAGSYSLYGGKKNIPVGWTSTLTEGDYWLALRTRTTTSGGAGMSFSNYHMSNQNTNFSGRFGAASNASNQFLLGMGSYSATTSAMPGSIAFTEIRGSAAANLRGIAYMFYGSSV